MATENRKLGDAQGRKQLFNRFQLTAHISYPTDFVKGSFWRKFWITTIQSWGATGRETRKDIAVTYRFVKGCVSIKGVKPLTKGGVSC